MSKLDPASGVKEWEVTLPGAVRSRPVEWKGAIALTCYDGHVRVLDISNGSVLSDYDAGGKVFATPLVSLETVYFGDMSGNFTALNFSSASRQ